MNTPSFDDPPSLIDQGAVGQVSQFKLTGEVTMKFCYCPAGEFTMGKPTTEESAGGNIESRQVSVRISKGFWIAQTPCTQRQWTALMGLMVSNPSHFRGDDLPVETVTWKYAYAFITLLSGELRLPNGWEAALPTDAQWEYACRAGTQSAYSFGNVLNGKDANCDGNSPYGTTTKGPNMKKTSAVASYAANPWGIFDMHGNVSEWCADWYDQQLSGGTDPVGPCSAGDSRTNNVHGRVSRGGSWCDSAGRCRSAYRTAYPPDIGLSIAGFRPALVSTNIVTEGSGRPEKRTSPWRKLRRPGG
jgi:formylglycine-generating enzyme